MALVIPARPVVLGLVTGNTLLSSISCQYLVTLAGRDMRPTLVPTRHTVSANARPAV